MATNDFTEDFYYKRAVTGLAPKTKKNYSLFLRDWLTFLGMNPTQIIEKRMRDLASQDLTERTYFEDRWRAFKDSMENAGTHKDTWIHDRLKIASSFLTRNGLKLALRKGDWKSNQKQQVIKKRAKLIQEDIKRMYGHANLTDKCLLLILAQSGFSEIDISELKIEDIKDLYSLPVNEHYVIEKPRDKNTHVQATCLSYEFLHDLRDLLTERGNPTTCYIFTSQTREKGIANIDVRRINERMKNLAERTFGKEDEKTKEFETRMLRSFYNSALLNVKPPLSQEIKDLLMGHEREGARAHYSYNDETIREAYISAFGDLSINGIQSREDLKTVKEDMKKQESHFLEIIADLKTENKKIKEEQDQKIAELGTTLKDLANLKVTIGNKVYPLKDIAKLKVPKTEATKE
jgi:hypothetical protein